MLLELRGAALVRRLDEPGRRRLQALLPYDKLGLDRETEILAESAAEGRAQQIGSIRDILERLADDPAVMERVKRRARALLARASD